MRILVLAKRKYTGKDLIDDRYGRLFELPERLQQAGHELRGVALSYRPMPETVFHSPAGVRWESLNALPFGLIGHGAHLDRLVAAWRPDVIWASSDALHAIIGSRLSRRHGISCVIDLYDNYESFALTRLPGLRNGLRRACRDASALTVVTHALSEMVGRQYRPSGEVAVLGNGVDPETFHPRDRMESRRLFGMPEQARIIGTAGSITRGRGIDDLFRAFAQLAGSDEDLWLAYVGPRDSTPAGHAHPRILDLGQVAQQAVPAFLSALDIAVICNRDSAFGRYCYPMKLEEAIACGVPVVAANVGDVAQRLAFDERCLYRPGDAAGLASRLRLQIEAGRRTCAPVAVSWADLAGRLEGVLARAAGVRVTG